jgi:HAD superfamily hydrolase (TIGR01509 family)
VAAVTGLSLILFDLNGVLYRYDRAARIARLSAVAHRTPDAVKAGIWDSGFEDEGDAGTSDAEGYLRGFGACLGMDLSEADWVAALKASITPIEAALALLSRLRPGVDCAVLTNNNLLVQRQFAVLYPEVAARVGSQAFVSAEFAARKPDPEVYRRCLARMGVGPAATLFVDDSEANVAGALAAGLEAHHTTGPEDLTAVLRGRSLLD